MQQTGGDYEARARPCPDLTNVSPREPVSPWVKKQEVVFVGLNIVYNIGNKILFVRATLVLALYHCPRETSRKNGLRSFSVFLLQSFLSLAVCAVVEQLKVASGYCSGPDRRRTVSSAKSTSAWSERVRSILDGPKRGESALLFFSFFLLFFILNLLCGG